MIPDIMPGGPFLIFTLSDFDPLILDNTYKFPRGTKVTCRQSKNISTTKINGRKGTIKEYSGFDDWRISIESIYIANNVLLARSELLELLSKWKKEKSLSIYNRKLLILGIEKVVLTDFELPNEDRDFELPFRLECLSDEDIDLTKPDLLDI